MQVPPSQSPADSAPAPPLPGDSSGPGPRLVLTTLALPSEPDRPARLLPRVAEALSALTGWAPQTIAAGQPDAALAALQADPGPWLAPLLQDPGLPLQSGCWAERLGAWRQPTLLVMGAGDPLTGLPAAGSALLERWQVPLLGLLQWGGSWEEQARRLDGLPWLGHLQPEQGAGDAAEATAAAEAAAALRLSLSLRWRRLSGWLA